MLNWYVYFANFFAGVFFAMGIPHFIQGISGNRFRTPFSTTKEKSSPVINVVWGLVSFLIGWALLFGVGNFVLGFNRSAWVLALGGVIMSVVLALVYGRDRQR